ncbi:MAG: cupredoxin domain-containing protein [Solirubrobacterales bacterium]
MQRILVAVAVPLGVGVLVAGCGSSDKKDTTATSAPKKTKTAAKSASPAAGGKTSNLSLSADPSGALKFTVKQLKTNAGTVTLTMDNPSDVPHAIAVEGNGVDKDGQTVTKGRKSTVTANLKPGKYEFYCPVDAHKQQGMEGTLTVS